MDCLPDHLGILSFFTEDIVQTITLFIPDYVLLPPMNKVPTSALRSSETASSSKKSSSSFFHHGHRVYFNMVLWDCLALATTGTDLLIKIFRSFVVDSVRLGAPVTKGAKESQLLFFLKYKVDHLGAIFLPFSIILSPFMGQIQWVYPFHFCNPILLFIIQWINLLDTTIKNQI